MNNDPFDSSAPERFFPASMVTEGVKENRQGITELSDRILTLERAAACRSPCRGMRSKQDVDMLRDNIKNFEYTIYAMTGAMVLVMALLTAGLVWVVMGVDERIDQIEKRIRDDERRKDGTD